MEIRIEYNEPALQIVTQPFLVGENLEEKAFEASKAFLANHRFNTPVEVVILEGARYYHLAEAHEALYNEPVTKCMLDCKRYFNGEWEAKISYCDLEGLCNGRTILIGDTIATGITLDYVLRRLLEDIVGNELDVTAIEIFTIAGARSVETKLKRIEEQFNARGIAVNLTFANAGFALAENGTDLLFEGAEYNPEAQKVLEEWLGGFLANMGCAIWDWGDRFRSPEHHLERIREYYSSEELGTPKYILDGIAEQLQQL